MATGREPSHDPRLFLVHPPGAGGSATTLEGRPAMERNCDVCGEPYQAQRATSKYCSTRCRTRASRGKCSGEVVPLAPKPQPAEVEGPGAVERATVDALEQVDRLDTPLGRACVVLARRLDSPGADTGSAMASVAKQLEALLVSANRGAGAASSPQQLRDELAERRRKHA